MSSRSEGLFRQCELRKGRRTQVAWIPDKLARAEAYVQLKGEDGWKITRTYGLRQGAPVETVLESIEPRKRGGV